jgi:hypothetical protein
VKCEFAFFRLPKSKGATEMSKRTENTIIREIDKLNENEALAVFDYIANLLSARMPKPSKNPINDELIATLADAKENKRARQVVEWEKVRRRNSQKMI